MTIYRLHRLVRAANNYDGSLLNAQRWNPAGTPMLYAASGLSLACLEILVHTKKEHIPDDYIWSYANLPDAPESFAERWSVSDESRTRMFGKQWAESRSALSIAVPSVIIPNTSADFNVLLNPLHDSYGAIGWETGGSFAFDPRLFVSAKA